MRPGYLSCRDCRIRLSAGSPAVALIGDRCPSCGAPLTAVASPSEVVGYRSFDLGDLLERDSDPRSERVPGPRPDPADLLSRREAASAREAQDDGRWSDNGGSVFSEVASRWPAPQ